MKRQKAAKKAGILVKREKPKKDTSKELFYMVVKCTQVDPAIRKIRQKQADEYNSFTTFIKAICSSQIEL